MMAMLSLWYKLIGLVRTLWSFSFCQKWTHIGLQRLIGWLVQLQAYIFNASACIRQRTSFSVTLSREKPCPVGPSLYITALSLKKKEESFYPRFFLGEGAFVYRIVGPKKKKKGGCVASSTDFHFSYNGHYQLNSAVIDRTKVSL